MQVDTPAITVTMENGGQVAAEVPKVTLKFQCGLLRETETFTGEDVRILCRDTLLDFVCDMLTFKVCRRRLARCVTTQIWQAANTKTVGIHGEVIDSRVSVVDKWSINLYCSVWSYWESIVTELAWVCALVIVQKQKIMEDKTANMRAILGSVGMFILPHQFFESGLLVGMVKMSRTVVHSR